MVSPRSGRRRGSPTALAAWEEHNSPQLHPTGVTHNAMSGILQSADNLVIAAGYAVSGAKRARRTLQWLASHGYEDLARNAIVVITDKDEVSSRVDKDAIEEHLSGTCRELIAVPHDRGVADGDLVTLDVLKPDTRRAYKEIAAAIVDGYRYVVGFFAGALRRLPRGR